MQFVSQLPNNPKHARRIVEHMRPLLDQACGDMDDGETPRPRS
jgi:hypothetical protein